MIFSPNDWLIIVADDDDDQKFKGGKNKKLERIDDWLIIIINDAFRESKNKDKNKKHPPKNLWKFKFHMFIYVTDTHKLQNNNVITKREKKKILGPKTIE